MRSRSLIRGKGTLLLPFGLQVPTIILPALLYVVVSPFTVPMLVPLIPGTLLEDSPLIVNDVVPFAFPDFAPFATTLVPALLCVMALPLAVPMLVPSVPVTLLESPPPLVYEVVQSDFPYFDPFRYLFFRRAPPSSPLFPRREELPLLTVWA